MSNSDWTNVDVGTLSEDCQGLYRGMKEAYRAYAAAKAQFEDEMQLEFCDQILAGTELKFGYKFGKLSVAVGPAREGRERKAASAKPSLGEWLAARNSEGLRS